MSPLEARLADLAAAGQTMTYGAPARDLDPRMAAVTAALEATLAQDAAAGRPVRAARCEGKLSQGQPAAGFFQTAAALGLDVGDPVAFVADQRARLSGPLE